MLAGPGEASAANPTVTNMADDARTGWYPEQAGLTRDAVSSADFGELFARQLQGQIYAQPLVSNGVVLVATEANRIYGLNPQSGEIRWQRFLGTPFDPSNIGGQSCGDLTPEVGITSTPVIDPAGTGTAYLTSKRASGDHYMHAVDLATGAEKPGFPVLITGPADNSPVTAFQSEYQLQRPGLLLKDGVVYAGFGGHCDIGYYRGWIMGVSTAGRMAGRWVTPHHPETGAGIWQAGSGLVSDGPNRILLATGNSVWENGTPGPEPIPGNQPPHGLGESVVRLNIGTDGKLSTADFFAPYDAADLDTWDADFSSGGPVALPDSYGTPAAPKPLAVVGKKGIVYLLDRNDLGGHKQGPDGGDRVVSQADQRGGVWSKPSLWPGDGGYLYLPTASSSESASGSSGLFDVYERTVDSNSGKPVLVKVASSPDDFGFGSSAPVVTSDGLTAGSGLVWIVHAAGFGGQLRVYDAKPAGSEYRPLKTWAIGTPNKFTPPGVGDRRIYVGTREGIVRGFGSPVVAAMSASGGDAGEAVVGTLKTATVTLRAQRDLTIQSFSVNTNPDFKLGAGTPTTPRAVLAGQSVSVPIELRGSTPGPKGATLRVATTQGEVLVSLSGTVRSSTGYLTRDPSVVSFGGVPLGATRTSNAVLRNTGTEPLTISDVDLPAAPVTVTGLPAVPFTIAPSSSVAVGFRYAPTVVGSYGDTLRVTTNGSEPEDNREIGVTGTAQVPAKLEIEPAGLQMPFGRVVIGFSSTRTLKVRNTGGAALRIMKSKPPSGGAFSASSMIDEGTTLQGGSELTRDVTFQPLTPGEHFGAWELTADTSDGSKRVELSGTGEVAATPTPAPTATPTPAPTATPVPTATPAPTSTSAPPILEVAERPRRDERPPPVGVLSRVKLSPSAFRPLAGKGASTQQGARAKAGATLSFSLSSPSRVRFTVGRVSRPRCKAAPSRRCPVFKLVPGVFALNGRAGANRIVFTGRLSGRRLPRGTYRLVARPAGGVDATAAFTVR